MKEIGMRYLLKIMGIFSLFVVLSQVSACNNGGKPTQAAGVPVVKLQTFRFDVDLYKLDTSHPGEGLVTLKSRYPDFLDYFLDTLMAYGIRGHYSDTTTGVKEGLKVFLTYKDFRDLEDSIQMHYPDTRNIDRSLTDAFSRAKSLLPDAHVPRIIYLNMGLSKWPTFPVDTNTLCVGLDMFLGDNFPHYASVGVPDFMTPHMRSSYLPVSVLNTWYKMKHPFIQDERSLLDLMIQRGKEQYFLHQVFPQTPDSILLGFTSLQMEWCTRNEADIYNFFVHNDMLYNKESVGRFGYVNDGPYAQGMEPPSDSIKYSPGNVGSWIGFRIVNSYMKHYPAITLSELINTSNDPARFLDSAKYKPR
jgi:hypothetical protein